MSPTALAPSAADEISLVPRLGERRDRELCVMSFVALLAGERHTDRPATACPVITTFVIKINDAIDCDTRQRLKPLAHDILGTNDGRSGERAWYLARTCVNDVFGGIAQAAGVPAEIIPHLPERRNDAFDFSALSSDIKSLCRKYDIDRAVLFDMRYLVRALARGSDDLVASAAAVLFVDAARLHGGATDDNPYWKAAIALFSRLCRIGKDGRAPVALIEEHLIADAIRSRTARSYAPLLFWLAPDRRNPRNSG
ncbi:MAG: hypothetical protein JJ899_00845 [Alphaproteobacteria bacterium]|nr:hypothetical protein [Alphaproteobacteria bacterium]